MKLWPLGHGEHSSSVHSGGQVEVGPCGSPCRVGLTVACLGTRQCKDICNIKKEIVKQEEDAGLTLYNKLWISLPLASEPNVLRSA